MNKAIFHVLLTLSLLTVVAPLHAQVEEWDELMQELAEETGTDDEEAETQAQLWEELMELHEHPIDINTATAEELSRLPFLEKQQVEAIIDYRVRHGFLRSLGELHLIPTLDLVQLRWLRHFVTITATVTTDKKRPQRIRQEFMTRLDVPLYERDGWSWARGIANRVRYTTQLRGHWDIGLRGEKDAGEPMFTHDSPLWDAWGGHVMLKDVRLGQQMAVKTAIVGDFKATFGEGLVMNTGFRLGKQQNNLWRTQTSLRPHRSSEESRFLRGVASEVALGQAWTITALYSWRQLDATVQKDNTVRAVNTTGLHRTDSELARRGTLGCHTTALHAGWQHGVWRAGATGLFQYCDHEFAQGTTLYRQIYPEGYLFWAASIDYGVRLAHWSFKGETAYSIQQRGGGIATLNSAAWRPSNDWQFSLIQRFYGKDYYSPHASAFGENSNVQNESGLCLLIEGQRLGPFGIRAYFDYFYSPWPRYTMTRYSTGCEGAVQATWHLSRQQSLILRYALKNKERSDRRTFSHRLRATYTQSLSTYWTAAATTFLHHYHVPELTDERSTGIAVMPRIDYNSPNARLRASLAGVWFSTADYYSRLYLYEPTLLQAFGMQMLYGKGERLIATLRWQSGSNGSAAQRFQWQIKAGVTHYRDRDVISSSPTLIRSPWKPDLQFLFRYTLR